MLYETNNNRIREFTPENKILQASYCELQYLLRGTPRVAYNSGVYGWNYDVYHLPKGYILTTGYRNMIGSRHTEIYEKYEKLAEELDNNRNSTVDYYTAIHTLLELMIDEIEKEKGPA